MTSPDRHYEKTVLRAFRREIARYCQDAAHGGDVPQKVGISLLTLSALSRGSISQVHRYANEKLDTDLPGAVIASIDFGVSPALTDPGYRFDFHPPASPTLPLTVPARRSGDRIRMLALTLGYGAEFRWVGHLAPASFWLALGRWPGTPGPSTAFRLPDYATFIPRGGLLLVRHTGPGLEFARSDERPGYQVRIDGQPLPRGGVVPARAEGRIEYVAADRPSTTLRYHAAPEK